MIPNHVCVYEHFREFVTREALFYMKELCAEGFPKLLAPRARIELACTNRQSVIIPLYERGKITHANMGDHWESNPDYEIHNFGCLPLHYELPY